MQNIHKLTFISQALRKRLTRWRTDNNGSTAVEFALVAAPFFFLLFGLLEVALIFIVSTTMEHGLNEAIRQVRTGSFQQSGRNQAAFERDLCDELFGLLDCDNNLAIDVRTFANFSGSGFQDGRGADGNFSSENFQFNPGGRNEIVLARAYYKWNLITPVISAPLSNLSDGSMLLTAGVAFRNEPFN